MAEAIALKLSTKGDYIKSGQRDDKSPLKAVRFCSRDQFFVCTAVELENYRIPSGKIVLPKKWTEVHQNC